MPSHYGSPMHNQISGNTVLLITLGAYVQLQCIRNSSKGVCNNEKENPVFVCIESLPYFPEYKSHPYFRPVIHGFVWLLYLTRTSATPLTIARGDGRSQCRRRNTRASCVQDRLDTSDRSDVRCTRRER